MEERPEPNQTGPMDEESQKKLVNESIDSSSGLNFLLNRSLDEGDVDQAFKYAAQIANFLQVDKLSPHNYYALFHVVSQYLIDLSNVIADRDRFEDRKIIEQYELVQYNKEILQRLYLMMTVGPQLAARGVARVVDVLDDISDMLKQSQDVIHALFLRYFLLCVFKNYIPDSSQQDMEKALHFLLFNFVQMNRMWVRIADSVNIEGNAEQRKELSVLIGMNITRISSLKNLSAEAYSRIVLPVLLKHVELCQDELAQEFILQSIIHAFPEDFHFQTIDKLFAIFGKVEENVPVLSIVNQLLERFLKYAGHVEPDQGRIVFITFAKNIEGLFSAESRTLSLTDKIGSIEKLLFFSLKLNPDDIRNVKNLMKFVNYHIELDIGDDPIKESNGSAALRSFLEIPIQSFTPSQYFEIDLLPSLIKRLISKDKYLLASKICDRFTETSTKITSMDNFKFVLSLTSSLVLDGAGKSCFFSLIHLIDAGSVQSTMIIIQELASAMESVNEHASERSILPIGYFVITLMRNAEKSDLIKLVQFILQYGQNVSHKNAHSSTLLYIEAARMLDILGFDAEASQFVELALQCYSEINKPNISYATFLYIVQFVLSTQNLDLSVNTQLCTIAAKFTDTMQATNAFLSCSYLFWRADSRIREFKNVQACLSKASKAAATTDNLAISLEALYHVLSTVSFYLRKKAPIPGKWVEALITLISEKHEEIKNKGLSLDAFLSQTVFTFYQSTIKYIKDNGLFTKSADGDDNEEDDYCEEEQ